MSVRQMFWARVFMITLAISILVYGLVTGTLLEGTVWDYD
jgi:hypothetical protein